jgi:SAM-dependent methyltransferase
MTPDRKDGPVARLAAALLSFPFVYEVVQSLAGQRRVAERLHGVLRDLPEGRLLDVGSAAGGFALRLGLKPVCLDIDPVPLHSLRRSGRSGDPVAGDATALPFRERCFDLTLCVAMSHHLSDRQLPLLVSELGRVTRGHLVFLDAVRNDSRAISRWLWRYDRGRFPRTRDALVSSLESRFEILRFVDFAVYHQYVICIARPRPSAAPVEPNSA